MDKQLEEVYSISKFNEFQQELTALIYYNIVNSIRYIYESSESYE